MPGVFACGNVLHVHDLVDYVSEEADLAGRAAAAFVAGNTASEGRVSVLRPEGGVRYTIPQKIGKCEDAVRVYFRVGRIMKNATITVSSGERVLFSKKKRKMAPGEMECIVLPADAVAQLGDEVIVCAKEDA